MPVRVQHQLLEHFVAGTTARAAAKSIGVQGRTAVIFFQRLRQLVASKQETFLLSGDGVEADESDLKKERNGRHERGAARKVPVFGLLLRDGKIYTAIVPDAEAITVIPIIREHVSPDSLVYTHCSQTCDVLNVSEFRYQRLKPSPTVLSRHGYHVNGIENFWNESRRYLRRFHGIPRASLYSYLKDCEWRFNESDRRVLSKQLKDWYQAGLPKA